MVISNPACPSKPWRSGEDLFIWLCYNWTIMTEVFNSNHANLSETKEQLLPPKVKTGLYLPSRVRTNEEIESMNIRTKSGALLTADSIKKRTGIERRYIPGKYEDVVRMGLEAIHNSQVMVRNIDAIFVSSSFPTGENLSGRIKDELGASVKDPDRKDFYHACSGFVRMINYINEEGNRERYLGKNILFLSTEDYSQKVVDANDPEIVEKDPSLAFTIFSAGAATLSGKFGVDFDIIESANSPFMKNVYEIRMPVETNKILGPSLYFPVPYSEKFYQEGASVYEIVRKTIPGEIENVIRKAGLTPEDIDLVDPHQGSGHVVEGGFIRNPKMREMGLNEKVLADFAEGNFSSASIPKALHKAIREGRLTSGMLTVLAGFGAGLYASTVIVKFN